jgi:hypothetical protein
VEYVGFGWSVTWEQKEKEASGSATKGSSSQDFTGSDFESVKSGVLGFVEGFENESGTTGFNLTGHSSWIETPPGPDPTLITGGEFYIQPDDEHVSSAPPDPNAVVAAGGFKTCEFTRTAVRAQMLSSAPPDASEVIAFSCSVASASGTPVVQTGTATLTSIGWTVNGGGGCVRVSPTDPMTLECDPPLQLGKVSTGGGILLPVEVMQHPADVTSGSAEPPTTQSVRLCRWLDAYDSFGELATSYPRYDRDRIRVKIPAAPFPNQNKITVRIATKKPSGTSDPEDAAADLECDKSGDFFISKPIILVGDGVKPNKGLSGDDAWNQVSPQDEQLNDVTHVAAPGGKIEVEMPLAGNPKIEFPIAPYTDEIQVKSYVVRSPSSNARIPADILTYLDDGIQRAKDVYKQAHVKIDHQGPYDCVLTDAELDLINSDRGDGARMFLIEGGNANY